MPAIGYSGKEAGKHSVSSSCLVCLLVRLTVVSAVMLPGVFSVRFFPLSAHLGLELCVQTLYLYASSYTKLVPTPTMRPVVLVDVCLLYLNRNCVKDLFLVVSYHTENITCGILIAIFSVYSKSFIYLEQLCQNRDNSMELQIPCETDQQMLDCYGNTDKTKQNN